MSHFAQIDSNNIVTQVIVAEQDFIDTGLVGDPATWIQTSYNTRNGIHYGPDGVPDGGVALRKNYAGVGYTYDRERDAFIPPKPFESWTLNESTCAWEPPVALPSTDRRYQWNEDTRSWDEVKALEPA
jgi:hypothetical protein